MIDSDTIEKLIEFRKERDWEQFHTFKNLAISLTLEAAELLEHVQWTADGEIASVVEQKHDEISSEMADIAIYLTYLAHDLGINLDEAVKKKLLVNAVKYPADKAKGNALKYDRLT